MGIEEQKREIIGQLEKGQVLEGVVKNVTSYGVFVDLGGVDGLVHITDLSWSRINHPNEVVELDQKLNVVILDFDDDKSRIQLGLKQLTAHPWEALSSELKVGDKVTGEVVVLADYGAFVEVEEGVEGLIHVSEISWSKKIKHLSEFVKIGDKFDVQVLELDVEGRKLNLGHKQTKDNPWDAHEVTYTIGSKHTGTIKDKNDKGATVTLAEGVEAFAPTRFLDKEDGGKLGKGDTVDFIVTEFSKE